SSICTELTRPAQAKSLRAMRSAESPVTWTRSRCSAGMSGMRVARRTGSARDVVVTSPPATCTFFCAPAGLARTQNAMVSPITFGDAFIYMKACMFDAQANHPEKLDASKEESRPPRAADRVPPQAGLHENRGAVGWTLEECCP